LFGWFVNFVGLFVCCCQRCFETSMGAEVVGILVWFLVVRRKKSETENIHLRKKIQVVEWRQSQAASTEKDSAATEAMMALKAVKREQRKLRDLRKRQRKQARRQQQQQLMPEGSSRKTRAFGSTFVRDDSDSDDDEEEEDGVATTTRKRRGGNKKTKKDSSLWATRKESLVRLVYSLIRAGKKKKEEEEEEELSKAARCFDRFTDQQQPCLYCCDILFLPFS